MLRLITTGALARTSASLPAMPADDTDSLRDRLTRQGEDALGKLAQDLLENPVVNGAISRAFEAREKAVQAQEVAMGALNIPSAADVERLTRRLRSVSQRLEGIEDAVDRLDERLGGLGAIAGLEAKLGSIDDTLGQLSRQMTGLRDELSDTPHPHLREQERLDVPTASGPAAALAPTPKKPAQRRNKPAKS